jgi:hypothetical protein
MRRNLHSAPATPRQYGIFLFALGVEASLKVTAVHVYSAVAPGMGHHRRCHGSSCGSCHSTVWGVPPFTLRQRTRTLPWGRGGGVAPPSSRGVGGLHPPGLTGAHTHVCCHCIVQESPEICAMFRFCVRYPLQKLHSVALGTLCIHMQGYGRPPVNKTPPPPETCHRFGAEVY